MAGAISNKNRTAPIALALAYASSFLLPVVPWPNGEYVPGYRIFAMALFEGSYFYYPHMLVSWAANPQFVAGMACLLARRPGPAALLGFAALGAALIPARIFGGAALDAIASGRIAGLVGISGYLAWLGSMAGLAAIGGYPSGRDERGRFRPRLRLGHLMYAVAVAALAAWGWQGW